MSDWWTRLLALIVMVLSACSTPAAPTAAPFDTRPLTLIGASGQRVSLRVEIADTVEKRSQGLMNRQKLDENAGMLFIFDEDGTGPFWMKDTPLPLSIAFIDKDRRIVSTQDMRPFDTNLTYPGATYRYALEVNQGFFQRKGLKVGDRVEW